MASYKITWTPRSAFATPLQSDTIFGHLCWAVKGIFDDDGTRLEEMLATLEQEPALLVSSAFPQGMLPRPAGTLSHEKLERFNEKLTKEFGGINAEQAYQLNKKAKKFAFMELKWLESRSFEYDEEELHYRLLKQHAEEKLRREKQEYLAEEDKPMEDALEFHNRIDRASGTTNGFGELFASPVTFAKTTFESYLETDMFDQGELERIFGHIALTGFGKHKNTGKGRFEIRIEPYSWKDCPVPNAYLNLSNMVPAETDPTNASYSGATKFAKVGGTYATTATPFKYPLYVIQPGAVFFAGEGGLRPKGCLLKNVHPDPKIVQNLYSYNIPIKIKGS